jgi:exopolyphosphatase/guanosine-5'-triphosphate,3'-diphosphate pyrophosphatase
VHAYGSAGVHTAAARIPATKTASRAHQILAGAIVAKTTMSSLDISRVDLCPWALREGIMPHHLQSSLDEATTLALQPIDPELTRSANNVRSLPPRDPTEQPVAR